MDENGIAQIGHLDQCVGFRLHRHEQRALVELVHFHEVIIRKVHVQQTRAAL